ncbi:hypothetical protein HOO65_020499 [Ceratocystis lukuohia]|uniref:Uncharacterized protein n=1 Tax=Ceratocystis lukuohia TaxID=2019550 RepID=A0ABR4MNT9_9PEZI
MNSLPDASTLHLLSGLPKLKVGDKVRFLGCVTAYTFETATLTIEHDYPKGNNVQASVDIQLHVDDLQASAVDIGTWTNVIGYITSIKRPSKRLGYTSVGVHALAIWPGGSFRLDTYERLVSEPDVVDLYY